MRFARILPPLFLLIFATTGLFSVYGNLTQVKATILDATCDYPLITVNLEYRQWNAICVRNDTPFKLHLHHPESVTATIPFYWMAIIANNDLILPPAGTALVFIYPQFEPSMTNDLFTLTVILYAV